MSSNSTGHPAIVGCPGCVSIEGIFGLMDVRGSSFLRDEPASNKVRMAKHRLRQ